MKCLLLFVVNDARFFLSHRLPLAEAARNAGYEVHVATRKDGSSARIQDKGFTLHQIPITRWGLEILEEIKTFAAILRLYRSLRPDLVHHVTIKPVLYGGLAARVARVPAVVSAMTGLGYVFVSQSLTARLLKRGTRLTYRMALKHPNMRLVFQNPDDKTTFVKGGLVEEQVTTVIKGSGVDMARFRPLTEPQSTPVVVLASRMLWDKGVGEFVEAARHLKGCGVEARFVLVGDSEPGNPVAVPVSDLEAWSQAGVVEWWGWRDDMLSVFAQSHLVCLPSYREGVPRVLIEAAACGRAVVTTDVPGCREIVRQGDNGLLVPVRDAAALATALRRLIEAPQLRRRMGARGREIAEAEFSVERIVDETLKVYRELLG